MAQIPKLIVRVRFPAPAPLLSSSSINFDHKAADGRYRSAGTFSTEKQALAVAEEAERHAAGPAQVFSTLLVSSGIRFCEAIGLQPADFDFETGILEVARSVVKVSRQHHPQGKTLLVRDYTKNGQTRTPRG